MSVITPAVAASTAAPRQALMDDSLGMDPTALKHSVLRHLEYTLAELPRHVDSDWEPYLALALAVALYVTKAPVPFVNKVQQRTPEQDDAEVERNKNWDPNAPLATKPAARASAPTPASGPATPPKPPTVAEPTRRDGPRSGRATAPAAASTSSPAPRR